MAFTIFDKFWHKTLKRPYYLARPIDIAGEGQVVVFLHGLGRTSGVWEHVIAGLDRYHFRMVAFDLLGFGASPKPKWIDYNTDDHAGAVIASIEKLKLKAPVVIVGHSMGCLVAARVARLRPDLVKHLVLYEMPLYEGLPNKRIYRARTDIYKRLYQKIVEFKPNYDQAKTMALRLGKKITGQEITPETWVPYARSLENTIIKQTTGDDIKQLPIPMDVIYGRFDMLVIRGKTKEIFGEKANNITGYTLAARHVISPKASLFLVERIIAAVRS